jgi:predicted metalloprotease with PDZ domain
MDDFNLIKEATRLFLDPLMPLKLKYKLIYLFILFYNLCHMTGLTHRASCSFTGNFAYFTCAMLWRFGYMSTSYHVTSIS